MVAVEDTHYKKREQSDQMHPPGQSLSFFFYEEWQSPHQEHNGITGGEKQTEAKVQINE